MKKIISVFVFVLIAGLGFAQNLVSNPSFENYSACPFQLDQTYLAIGWSSYRYSPDYYNACNTGGMGVPSHNLGYQAAASGNGYTALIAFDVNGDSREVIGSQLLQTLTIGQKYYVLMKVCLSEFNPAIPQYVPCNKIGIKFSTVSFSLSNPASINNFAHVYTNSIISDTMNWTTIQGSIIADSSYQYIMLGNFFDDLNTDTVYRANGVKSYFYIDDICVSTDSTTCAALIGIDDITNENWVSIFPSPANNLLTIICEPDDELSVSFYNSLGQKIIQRKFYKQILFDLSDFSNGIYYINIQSKNRTITKKIIINHY